MLAGAAFFKAAPTLTAFFLQAKKESLVVVTKHDIRAIYNGKYDPKKNAVIINFLRAQNQKLYVVSGLWSQSRPNLVGA